MFPDPAFGLGCGPVFSFENVLGKGRLTCLPVSFQAEDGPDGRAGHGQGGAILLQNSSLWSWARRRTTALGGPIMTGTVKACRVAGRQVLVAQKVLGENPSEWRNSSATRSLISSGSAQTRKENPCLAMIRSKILAHAVCNHAHGQFHGAGRVTLCFGPSEGFAGHDRT